MQAGKPRISESCMGSHTGSCIPEYGMTAVVGQRQSRPAIVLVDVRYQWNCIAAASCSLTKHAWLLIVHAWLLRYNHMPQCHFEIQPQKLEVRLHGARCCLFEACQMDMPGDCGVSLVFKSYDTRSSERRRELSSSITPQD